MTIKDIVAEYQTGGLPIDELLPDDERLRKPTGRGLYGIVKIKPEPAAIAEENAERPADPAGWMITRISRIPASMSIESG